MTKYDVKNYLEKIYKIPVMNVQTRVVCGEIKRAKSLPYLVKDDDYRESIVDLVNINNFIILLKKIFLPFFYLQPKHVQFEYPDLSGEKVTLKDELEKIRKQFEFTKKQTNRQIYKNNRHNVPDWFGI